MQYSQTDNRKGTVNLKIEQFKLYMLNPHGFEGQHKQLNIYINWSPKRKGVKIGHKNI